jgi:hypothetical protein
MKILALFAVLLALAFSSQSTYAGAATGEVPEVGYWWSYPYGGDYSNEDIVSWGLMLDRRAAQKTKSFGNGTKHRASYPRKTRASLQR